MLSRPSATTWIPSRILYHHVSIHIRMKQEKEPQNSRILDMNICLPDIRSPRLLRNLPVFPLSLYRSYTTRTGKARAHVRGKGVEGSLGTPHPFGIHEPGSRHPVEVQRFRFGFLDLPLIGASRKAKPIVGFMDLNTGVKVERLCFVDVRVGRVPRS